MRDSWEAARERVDRMPADEREAKRAELEGHVKVLIERSLELMPNPQVAASTLFVAGVRFSLAAGADPASILRAALMHLGLEGKVVDAG